ncbi:TPA: hypothetical protein N3441_002537 [Klebsiella quasipneumoniae]|uniref:hypothetical protein n=1 Tax=Klebsiella quasipneumoniae TaxID=1463165 RepID=UPI00388F8D95|nr:hypothetical protein [Klebsiella quasipneumoniae subsp. similipneumoniae]HCM7645616.1 hypothetical protein [Klebsiella quasipneumoniae]HCM7708500.1 hypothetical protein [Klebsiella quasipneumoniae]
MSTSNVRKLRVGQRVTIMTSDGKKLNGILVDKCDWSVGCPVVEANGIKYGIGYQAEVVSISESVDIEKQSRI